MRLAAISVSNVAVSGRALMEIAEVDRLLATTRSGDWTLQRNRSASDALAGRVEQILLIEEETKCL